MSTDALQPSGDEHRFWLFVGAVSGLGLVLLAGLEFTTIDLDLARWMYDPARHLFPWADHWLTKRVAHDSVRFAAAIVLLWLMIGIWKPVGILRLLPRAQRGHLVVGTVVCLLAVGLLKRASAIHCPWDLAEFGGSHAYLRLFDSTPRDWQRGACFPAGHALAAFAFIGGYFAWRSVHRRIARWWLAIVMLVGGLAGYSQHLRGAHFLSHTLWTLWLCWTLSAALAWAARLRSVARS